MLMKTIGKLFYNPYRAVKRSPYISMGDSILGKSFSVNMVIGRTSPALEIGDDCILQNQNIFESDQGFIKIGDRTFINDGTKLISRCRIEIGNDVTIAWNCTIYDHDSHSLDYREREKDQWAQLKAWHSGKFISNKDWSSVNTKPIKISDHAWLGFDVIVLKGVTIGEGAIIGARSVVAGDIPPWCIAAGNPAKVIRELPLEMRKTHGK